VKTLTRVAIIVALVVAAGGAVWYFGPFRRNGNVLTLPGTVEIQEVRLGSKVGGRVAAVYTREGELVKAGQELVRFEAPELEAQRDQLLAKLKAAEAELKKARDGPRPEEKDEARAIWQAADARRRKTDAGWREEQKRQARNEMEAAEADFVQTTEEFNRVDGLFKQGTGVAVTRAEWELARANRDRAQRRTDAAKANYDMLMNGSRAEDKDEAAAEAARYKAVYDRLLNGTREEDKLESEANVEEIRGRLREVEANLRESTVRAPEPAVVEVLAVRPGDLVGPGQPAVRVLRADDLWVKVFVPETELGRVRLNQAVTVTIDSYPGKQFAGHVEFIANSSEFTPRNVQSADERRHQVFAVKVRVPNPEGVFKAGMAAEVQVPLREAP
jgi:HlyD family secretion protein